MKAPSLEKRRAADFAAELRERARVWIPSWGLADGERDFGRALLDIAARFSSEVAERLDRAGEKMQRGFLDFLAVRGQAARPSRMPVVFKLADTATEPVLASAPVRMQVDAASGDSVTFETETDVRLVPGRLETVVGVDGAADAVYFPPPGLSNLEPLEPLPLQWELKSFAAAGATTLQVDPEAGLAKEMIVEAAGQQYRITKVDNEIITIDPPLTADLPAQTVVRKVTAFAPFDGVARNRQEHALYLGQLDLLDVESAATIAVVGAPGLRKNVTWQYWGKVDGSDDVRWQPLKLAPDDQQTPDAAVLTKRKGSIEPLEIAGKNSRWIRGYTKNVPPDQEPFQPSELALRINATKCGKTIDCPPDEKDGVPSPAAEGMANTTPLVLESPFFPLGREPRLFDAFYLGSAEAFSKKGAEVQLCFEMADPTFASLAALRTGDVLRSVVAGVGADRQLHLLQFNASANRLEKFRDRDALQPPSPGFNGKAEPTNPVFLDLKPKWRLPMWNEGFDFLVGTTAGANVWLWHEKYADQANSGWILLAPIPDATPLSAALVDGLVHLDAPPAPQLAALRDGLLSFHDAPGLDPKAPWIPVDTKDPSNNTVILKSIVPVLVADSNLQLVTSAAEGMVGISDNNKLYRVSATGLCKPVLPSRDFDLEVQPVAFFDGTDFAVAAVDTSQQLIAHHTSAGTFTAPIEPGAQAIGALDLVLAGGELHFLAAVTGADEDYLASWAPFSSSPFFFESPIRGSVGEIGGGPTAFAQNVAIPGQHADIFVADFHPLQRLEASNVAIEHGVVVPTSAPALDNGDFVALVGGSPDVQTIVSGGPTRDGEVLYPISAAFSAAATGPLLAYSALAPHTAASITPPDTLELQSGDQAAVEHSFLLIDGVIHEITDLDKSVDPWIATVSPADLTASSPGQYFEPLTTNGRAAPFMQLNPATTGNWDETLVKRVKLLFPGASPERQWAKVFSEVGGHPVFVALAEEFTTPPGNAPTFVADDAPGQWLRLLGDTSSNPELSWEYWNGKGWWKLDVALDKTLNLKLTGALQFKVPDDIASSDWAGKPNFWIRARLVGGEYGKEVVNITTTQSGNKTTQTIDRSKPGAPTVVKLHIAYQLCKAVRPALVLAQDSGSIRDQSDANRTHGAIVEAFVPLAVTVGRLSKAAAAAPETAEECPPPCQCPGEKAATTVVSAAGASAPDAAWQPSPGRALFVGLNATPSGAPVNVLLLVDKESLHESFAPMKIEALVADRFVPVVAEDTTRALGESGLLSMAFAVPPTPRELFGSENLTWLKLTPRGDDPTNWKPNVRGAYLNAVWASAAETLTRELLGSSQGEPNLTVFLARPPVLRDTLELRVREPLGDEERQQLRADDENRVLSNVEGLRGDWVLWKQVPDPGDEAADARVYALDEGTGEVRFGDGQHGMIPPIGLDSIVAFTYRRTELGKVTGADVPGNSIAARTALNLVSPVETVEAAFAADQAAGGAPPESDERVVRFGTARLRHRSRAVTARDFEDLALESSPDIVQARCFTGRGGVRLVVVMRGKDPQPNAAEVRELRRLLLADAPASLAAHDALRIGGPRIRRLRVVLKPRVATLDHAGDVARAVQQKIEALFDTTTWLLGTTPKEEDIARAIIDTRHLEGLGDVQLREVLPEGERPWKDAVKRNELVMLDDDPLRLEFETVEVIS